MSPALGTGVFSGCTALTDVYYTGAQAQWDQIRTPKGEDVLGSAELHCNAAAHTFAGDWVETTPATCTDDGVLTRICTDPGCGRTQTRIVPSLGHDWDDGVTRIEPDGLLAGVVVYTCGRCALTAIELTAPEIWAYQHFTDLAPESWSYEGIQYCVATGLMSGVGGTTFLPGGVTTRAQLVQILYNLEGEPAVTGSTPFTDLTADWYQDAVTWAYQNHIVSGTSATTFAPDLVVTREQIAVVLVDFLMNVYGLERTWIPAALDVYPDGPDVSDWAQAGMSDALSLKLISGATNGESPGAPPESARGRHTRRGRDHPREYVQRRARHRLSVPAAKRNQNHTAQGASGHGSALFLQKPVVSAPKIRYNRDNLRRLSQNRNEKGESG